MKIYVGIDGTDNNDATPYAQGACMNPFAYQSFVKRIGTFGFETFHYIQGTTNTYTGSDTEEKGKDAADRVSRFMNENRGTPKRSGVFIGGFSRGAYSALIAAHKLEERGIPVDGLFLFDAVDRSSASDHYGDRLPDTVVRAYHAIRSNDANSRNSFGRLPNLITSRAPNLLVQAFKGTHGAIGGWPQGEDDYMRVGGEPNKGKSATKTLSSGLKTAFPSAGLAINAANTLGSQPNKPKYVVGETAMGMHWETNVSPAENEQAVSSVWTWMQGNVIAATQICMLP